jgi:hypothetical protein
MIDDGCRARGKVTIDRVVERRDLWNEAETMMYSSPMTLLVV